MHACLSDSKKVEVSGLGAMPSISALYHLEPGQATRLEFKILKTTPSDGGKARSLEAMEIVMWGPHFQSKLVLNSTRTPAVEETFPLISPDFMSWQTELFTNGSLPQVPDNVLKTQASISTKCNWDAVGVAVLYMPYTAVLLLSASATAAATAPLPRCCLVAALLLPDCLTALLLHVFLFFVWLCVFFPFP